MVKKKKKKNIKFQFGQSLISILILLLFAILVGGIIWGIVNDKFQFNPNLDGIDVNININDLLDDPSTSDMSCSLDFSKNTVCVDENFIATLTDGRETHCYIFANDGSGWDAVYEGYTNVASRWSETRSISNTGEWDLRGFCDKDNNLLFSDGDCFTNIEPLEVIDCSPEPSVSDGTHVGGIGGSTVITGDNTIITIDLSGLESGNCDLMAQISYAWDYIDADACFGIQSQESMHFEFHDSDSLVWEETHINPIGLGFETDCGLNWDGVNNWQFIAEKVQGIESCEIFFEFDVSVITCNCK